MASDHPFQHLFETLGRVPTSHAESVNRQAFEILSDILTVPVEKTGRCILLRAPRAGHGKTHLLSRIQHQLGSSSEFIPLQAAFGCRIDAASVTDDTLRRLVRPLPASGGLTVLDLLARRLFASALQPLVGSGEVPCQDREGALTALRTRPIETFDFHHPNAVTAHWARENFEVLGQRLAQELAQRSGLTVSGISFWVDVLFRFASAPLENSARVRVLADEVHAATGLEMEHLEALLGLITQLMRVVLVADDLEGFSTDETAALRLAAFLGTLRQSVERLDVILSLNQDIWQNAFLPRLSGGLADRLSEVVVELEPLTEKEMAALLESRVPGLGSQVLERIDVDSAGTHARGLIRAAGMAWLKATATDSTPEPEAPVQTVAPAEVPAPVLPVAPVEPAVQVAPVFAATAAEEIREVEEIPTHHEPVVVAPPAVMEAEPIAETAVPVAAPVFEAPPAAETPAFTFSKESTPVSDVASTWQVPEFSPAAPPEAAAEPVVFQAHPESPFRIETPQPAASFAPPQWQEVAPAAAPWTPPAPAVEIPAAAAPHPQAVVEESPFQIAASPEIVAAPLVASLVPEPVQHQFPADSPFQMASSPHVAHEVPAPTFAPSGWQERTAPAPTPPPEPHFQAVAPAHHLPENPAPAFTPAPAQQVPAAAFHAPAESPFEAAPAQEAPAPVFQAVPEPVTPPPSVAETDRVDDLLRQFRERYGRGSL